MNEGLGNDFGFSQSLCLLAIRAGLLNNTHHREHRGHVPEKRARERVARRSCEAQWRFTRSDRSGDATATQREAQDAYGQIFNKKQQHHISQNVMVKLDSYTRAGIVCRLKTVA